MKLRLPKTPFFCGLVLALCLAFSGPLKAEYSPKTIASCPHSPAPAFGVSNPVPMAAFWEHIMGNRRRMIQVGLVAVCLGFFFLSWSRK